MIADIGNGAGERRLGAGLCRVSTNRHVLWADQHRDAIAGSGRKPVAGSADLRPIPDLGDRLLARGAHQSGSEQVGVAEEVRHEQIGRRLVERPRRTDLGDARLVHHHDQVRHCQRLGLVVSDVDDRGADAAVDALDFGLHLLAQLLVERAERLVHQQQARL
jgi:hypothetical protein